MNRPELGPVLRDKLGPALLCLTVNVLAKEMVYMTDSDPTRSTPAEEEPATRPQPEPDISQPAEDPGYLIETGQAAAEDGSVAPIIGGLPAVEGSAWDIGAALEDRGAGLADQQRNTPDQASHHDTHSS